MTENNHYSPVFSNKPWAKNGQIWKFSRNIRGGIDRSPSGPRAWGREKFLYPQNIEDELANTIESRVAPLYKKLLDGILLTKEERLLWSYWILCQYARTPSFILDFAKLEEDVLGQLPEFSEYALTIRVDKKLAAATSNITDFSLYEKIIPFIVLRDWIVYRAYSGEFFIKSDNPVIIIGKLANDDARIIYPLSPEKCFEARVIGSFPPSQIQAEYDLKMGETDYFLRQAAYHSDQEVISHIDNDSEGLRRVLEDHLGQSSGHFRVGTVPEF